ncbi:MAG TPA: FRG domain-containing protein [Allosphingosinicella sp.]|jgi:hypothetical protein
MRHAERAVQTIGEFVVALRDTAADGLVWYRGQERSEWPLIPALARHGDALAAELLTIKRFKQNAAPYLPARPASEWEWVFLMQHHRAPTRLLDWTESPLVALFFALWGTANDDADAAVWCLDPVALNRLAGHRRQHARDILAFGIDAPLDDYLPDRVNERVSTLNPIAAIGPRNSARMVAQAGTFTVIHAEAMAIEEVGDNQDHIWKIVVPSAARPLLRAELALLGVHEHSLFPDLDRVAALAKEMIL